VPTLIQPEAKAKRVQRRSQERRLQQLIDEYYIGLGDTTEREVQNILLDQEHADIEHPIYEILSVMQRPEYFAYTCRHLLNIELIPFQVMVLQELWHRKFPMLIMTRGGGKTWMLALYALLRALFDQGSKVVVVGAAFRQSKLIFEYMEQFWRNSPILRNIVGTGKHQGPKRDIDRCNFYVGASEIIAIPLGDGTKIRGLRANYVLADEFASIPQEIFEVVIKGFASVSSSPDVRVKDFSRIEVLKMLGYYDEAEEAEEDMGFGNQTVISGTAYYSFNHFYDYWRRYKSIVESKGQQNRLEEIFHGEVPEGFDWTDYSIIRAPYKCLPKGFMDETSVAQSKATVHQSIYQMEYEACFATDSDGFFKRSLIESCVTKEPIVLPSGSVQFHATICGSPNARYVYGIDPASEQDNFAIVILELCGDHRRIVYSWSINRQVLRERMKNQGKQLDKSFYSYCARKIRDLMKRFPTEHIGMDTQGGGIAVMEALHELEQMEENERPLWPYIKQGEKDVFWWEEEKKPTDGEPGLHILHMVQFAQAKFTVDANHGLRKDFENKTTLFPYFDSASIGEALTQDKIYNREYDTLEDCVIEIEELKDELATIIHDQTSGGRDRWDTPEVKLPGNKKGRLRKDRYSALVIANMVARVMDHGLEGTPCPFSGGFVGQKRGHGSTNGGRLYVGPDHLVSKMTGVYGKGVRRQ